eukprot:6463354-Amphidinium_carterae.1
MVELKLVFVFLNFCINWGVYVFCDRRVNRNPCQAGEEVIQVGTLWLNSQGEVARLGANHQREAGNDVCPLLVEKKRCVQPAASRLRNLAQGVTYDLDVKRGAADCHPACQL